MYAKCTKNRVGNPNSTAMPVLLGPYGPSV